MTQQEHNQKIEQSMLEKLKPMELAPLPENPLVSVLIANYNYGRYIGEAIESVLNQTYQNFEIVICDDGSTDNSLEVIRGYAERDSRVKYVAKENGGVASALNAAFSIAKGCIICFLDADDLYFPEKLEVVVQRFKEDANSGFLVHPVQQIDVNKHPLGIYPLTESLPKGWIAEELLARAGIMEFPPVSGLCLRREVANTIFPLNVAFRTNADGVIQRVAPLTTKVSAVAKPLAQRRVHRENVTYSAQVSAEYIEKMIEISRKLWEEQYQFLKAKSPGFEDFLVDYERSFLYICQIYVLKRLRGDKSWHNAWTDLYHHPEFCDLSLLRRVLWFVSRLIPQILFPTYMNIWRSSNRIKRIFSFLLRK